MPVYNYKALDPSGNQVTGVLDADGLREVRLKLKSRSLYAVDIEPAVEIETGDITGRPKARKISFFGRFRIKKNDLAMLTRQIGTMLKSGIQIMPALTILSDQIENKNLRAIFLSIREKVAAGTAFSDALTEHSYCFDDLYVNMVKAGEASGELDEIMLRLSDYLLASNRIQAKVKAALTYPIFIIIVAVCMVAFMLTFVLPQVTTVITSQTNAKLPLPTQILLSVSDFISTFWWVIAGAFVGFIVFVKGLKKSKDGRRVLDNVKLRIPFLGVLFKKAAISRFCSTFSTLLESGIPAVEALRVVKNVVNNQILTDILEEASQRIIEGSDISMPFKRHKIFPPVVVYMISIGEQSGNLPVLLNQISNTYDEEIEIQSQKLTSILEPILILITSAIIGAIVISILMPILEMSNIA